MTFLLASRDVWHSPSKKTKQVLTPKKVLGGFTRLVSHVYLDPNKKILDMYKAA